MKHGAFFNGIGGFMYAAELMGWENVFYSEIDPFCNQVTKFHFPNAIQHGDIKKTNFKQYKGVDIFTGGFPCQPFSTAGNRKGTEDTRYLWPSFFRAIKQARPRWCLLENVAGILSMVEPTPEVVNVEIQKTILQEEDHEIITEEQWYILERICTDLESIGYTVQPVIIPAAAIGAPHKRDRIWIIANCTDTGFKGLQKQKNSTNEPEPFTNSDNLSWLQEIKSRRKKYRQKGESLRHQSPADGSGEIITNTNIYGLSRWKEKKEREITVNRDHWSEFPTQSPVCSRNDGVSPKLDGITFSDWRSESIKAYGNAIVPQVALEIFKAIEIADYEYRTRK